jgi:gluconokinase
VLRAGAPAACFALLSAERTVLAARIAHRPGHFMPLSLLDSQLATLEPLEPDEDGVTLDAGRAPEQAVTAIRAWLDARPAG